MRGIYRITLGMIALTLSIPDASLAKDKRDDKNTINKIECISEFEIRSRSKFDFESNKKIKLDTFLKNEVDKLEKYIINQYEKPIQRNGIYYNVGIYLKNVLLPNSNLEFYCFKPERNIFGGRYEISSNSFKCQSTAGSDDFKYFSKQNMFIISKENILDNTSFGEQLEGGNTFFHSNTLVGKCKHIPN